tara:strand:- start:773 stop:1156 length:384 start_codon:yes stop_codon:yes gene_type:complete
MIEVNLSEIEINKYYFIYSNFYNSLCSKDSSWYNYRKIIAKVKNINSYYYNDKLLYKIIFTDVMHVPSAERGSDLHFILEEDLTKNNEIIYNCTHHPYKCSDDYYNYVLNSFLYKITGERNFNLTYF